MDEKLTRSHPSSVRRHGSVHLRQRPCKRHPCEGSQPAGGDGRIPGSGRQAQPGAQRVHLAQRRSGSCPGSSGDGAPGKDRARPGRPSPVLRGSDPRKGPDRGPRLADHPRVLGRVRSAQPRERAGGPGARTRGLHPVGPDQHSRARPVDRDRERPLRDHPQPVGSVAQPGRVERGSRRRGRLCHGANSAWERWWRLHPHTRVLLWVGRLEAEPWPRSGSKHALGRGRGGRRPDPDRRGRGACAGHDLGS